MSGVIDEDGTQWEHCNACGGWVRIQDLLYEAKSEEHPYGRDLCATCATAKAEKPRHLLQIRIDPKTGATVAALVPVEDLR